MYKKLVLINPKFYQYRKEEIEGIIEHSKIIFKNILNRVEYRSHIGKIMAVHYGNGENDLHRVFINKENGKIEKIEKPSLETSINRFYENKKIMKIENSFDRRNKILEILNDTCQEIKPEFLKIYYK